MDWWTAAWTAVVNVADGFESFCNAAGDAISDLAETGQNLIQDGFDAIGDALGAKALFHAIGVWLAAPLGLLGVVIKGAFNIIGGYYGGIAKMLAAVMTLNGSLFVEGLLDLVSSIAGAALVMTGEIVAYFQGAFVNERPLTQDERHELRRLFRNSIAYYNIRVIDGWSGLGGLSPQSFTVGNRIYLKKNTPDELVHECVHVWQYQHLGARYTSDALLARLGHGYQWRNDFPNVKHWLEFNCEQAAQFIQDAWRDGGLQRPGQIQPEGGVWSPSPDLDKRIQGKYFDAIPPDSWGVYDGTIPYEAMVNDAADTIRGRKSLRLSQLL